MPRFTSTWRRMAESLRSVTRFNPCPEYSHHSDRSHNHRYYR